MTEAISALERATARLAACDPADLDETKAAVDARAEALGRLRDLDPAHADRVRGVIEAGDAAIARLRATREQWRAELETAGNALRYVKGLRRAPASARRIDVVR